MIAARKKDHGSRIPLWPYIKTSALRGHLTSVFIQKNHLFFFCNIKRPRLFILNQKFTINCIFIDLIISSENIYVSIIFIILFANLGMVHFH